MQDPSELKQLPRSGRVEKLFDFDPFDYQRELLDYADESSVTQVALKPGRQVGKSLTGGHIAAERALAGKDVMILAPYEDTTEDMMAPCRDAFATVREKFNRAKENIRLTPEKENKNDWQFPNGGRVRARTVGTDGTQIRGKNPSVVLVDEAAYIPDRIYDNVIEPYFLTHDTYEFYLFSTPAGKSGYFYEAVQGEKADNWWTREWPSTINPLNDTEWIEEKRKEKDSLSFAQEYLGEFVDEGETLFSYEDIQPLLSEPELEPPLYLGVDVAREGKDRTVFTEMDGSGRVNVVASEEKSTMDGVLGRIRNLHSERNYEKIVVEENSMGGGVIDFGGDMGDVLHAFKSTSKSKHQLYKQLQRDIETETLSIPQHRRLIDELTSLQYKFTQHGYMKVSHPEGGHDDHPDSLAFANWGRSGVNQTEVVRRNARATMHKGKQ